MYKISVQVTILHIHKTTSTSFSWFATICDDNERHQQKYDKHHISSQRHI